MPFFILLEDDCVCVAVLSSIENVFILICRKRMRGVGTKERPVAAGC